MFVYNLTHLHIFLHYYQHFVGGQGPTADHPDPLRADGIQVHHRPSPTIRHQTFKRKKTSAYFNSICYQVTQFVTI